MKLSRTARVLIVATLIVIQNLLSIPDVARVFGLGLGEYGFATRHGIITRLDAGGPAQRSGLRVGDRVSTADSTARGRYGFVRGIGPYAGATLDLTVLGLRPHHVVLIARVEPVSTRFLVTIRFALAALTVTVATMLLLTRPEPASWGFFIYCLSVISLPGAVSAYILPWNVRFWIAAATEFIIFSSYAGGVLFAWTFAGQPLKGRTLAVVTLVWVACLAHAGMQDFSDVRGVVYPDAVEEAFFALFALAMLAGFIDSYRHDDGPSRQRLKWMISAFVIVSPVTYYALSLFPAYLSYGQYVFFIALQAILPIIAAYAMFRKRVVDVSFVISRTLVFGTLTAVTAGAFELVDVLVGRSVEASRLGLLIEVAVALIIAFSLGAIKDKLDQVIDGLLFRDRHRAERQLRQTAVAILHASTEETVRRALVRLPVDALQLTSAVLYMRDNDTYLQRFAVGDSAGLPPAIGPDDILVLALRSQLGEIRLNEVPLSAVKESRTALLAVPVAMRGEIGGFVLYGAHRNGADIDRDELHCLRELARNASAAFDHIKNEALRTRVATLEQMLGLAAPLPPLPSES